MIKKFEYQPKGVCSIKMIIEVEGDIIQKINIIGGCPGNSVGVSKLCVGRTLDEIIEILSGIDCRGRGTSCPDQLAKACIELKKQVMEYAN